MLRPILITTLFHVSALFSVVAASPSPHPNLPYLPDPSMCTLENRDRANLGKDRFIAVVGLNNAGAPDPCYVTPDRCGDYRVTVRDFAGNPIQGLSVVIDFRDCPDIQLACDQDSSVTGEHNIDGHRILGYSNASGQFTFKIIGAANSASTLPGFVSPGTAVTVQCAHVTGQSIHLGDLAVAAYDIDGLGSTTSAAVNSADVAKVKAEALLATSQGMRARSDYNDDGAVNAGDVAISASIALTSPAYGSVKTTTDPAGQYCP